MGRRRLYAPDAAFWRRVRALIIREHSHSRSSWADIAEDLRISKQHLSAFVNKRSAVLGAEPLLRICRRWDRDINYRGVLITTKRITAAQDRELSRPQMTMEFDNGFELRSSKKAVVLKKPPGSTSFIRVRVDTKSVS